MNQRIHSIQSAISQNNQLSKLFIQAQTANDLQTVFKRCLPKEIQEHCHVSCYLDDTLSLVVENGNWMTRLRYIEDELTLALKKQVIFHTLKKITYCIDPQFAKIKPKGIISA